MSMRLYVGNLPWKVRDQDLEALFQGIGEVISARVITDRENPSRSRGFGFVEMESEAATKAIEQMNGHEMEGRPLRVNEAQERTSRPPNGGGGGGGGGGRYGDR